MRSVYAAACLLATGLAAEIEIRGNEANPPQVVFVDDSSQQLGKVSASVNAINATTTLYAPDFVTADGTSVDDVGTGSRARTHTQ